MPDPLFLLDPPSRTAAPVDELAEAQRLQRLQQARRAEQQAAMQPANKPWGMPPGPEEPSKLAAALDALPAAGQRAVPFGGPKIYNGPNLEGAAPQPQPRQGMTMPAFSTGTFFHPGGQMGPDALLALATAAGPKVSYGSSPEEQAADNHALAVRSKLFEGLMGEGMKAQTAADLHERSAADKMKELAVHGQQALELERERQRGQRPQILAQIAASGASPATIAATLDLLNAGQSTVTGKGGPTTPSPDDEKQKLMAAAQAKQQAISQDQAMKETLGLTYGGADKIGEDLSVKGGNFDVARLAEAVTNRQGALGGQYQDLARRLANQMPRDQLEQKLRQEMIRQNLMGRGITGTLTPRDSSGFAPEDVSAQQIGPYSLRPTLEGRKHTGWTVEGGPGTDTWTPTPSLFNAQGIGTSALMMPRTPEARDAASQRAKSLGALLQALNQMR